jgi:hypothetical protein
MYVPHRQRLGTCFPEFALRSNIGISHQDIISVAFAPNLALVFASLFLVDNKHDLVINFAANLVGDSDYLYIKFENSDGEKWLVRLHPFLSAFYTNSQLSIRLYCPLSPKPVNTPGA